MNQYAALIVGSLGWGHTSHDPLPRHHGPDHFGLRRGDRGETDGGDMSNNWIPGRRWLAVQTAPRREKLAAEQATLAGWHIFFPRSKATQTRTDGWSREIEVPYLQGYLFAQANKFRDPFDLGKIHGVASVLAAIEDGRRVYYEIPDTDPVMRALLAMADAEGLIAVQEAQNPIVGYHPGDTITIARGSAFAGHQGLVDKLDRKRRGADVWLTILGGATKVFVPHEQIGQVESRA